jgi:hypothetical protein
MLSAVCFRNKSLDVQYVDAVKPFNFASLAIVLKYHIVSYVPKFILCSWEKDWQICHGLKSKSVNFSFVLKRFRTLQAACAVLFIVYFVIVHASATLFCLWLYHFRHFYKEFQWKE